MANFTNSIRAYGKTVVELQDASTTLEMTFYPAIRDLLIAALRSLKLPSDVRVNTGEKGAGGNKGVPDLAMEVISEGSWQRDRIQKKALYEQFGLPEYWIVDPDSRSIEVFVLVSGGYQLHGKVSGAETVGSKLLAGFGISFSELIP